MLGGHGGHTLRLGVSVESGGDDSYLLTEISSNDACLCELRLTYGSYVHSRRMLSSATEFRVGNVESIDSDGCSSPR